MTKSMSTSEQMRLVISENRRKLDERDRAEWNSNKDNLEKMDANTSLKPRSPKDIPFICEIRKISDALKDQESTERLSLRLSEDSKNWISNYIPLFTSKYKKSKKLGAGGILQLMIQELIWHRSELREHLHEIRDYIRQVQNSEKEYYSEIGRSSEDEARKRFQKSIKNLELVLNVKRLKYEKLMTLFQAGVVDQAFVDEIHYYLNIEVYEKWGARGY